MRDKRTPKDVCGEASSFPFYLLSFYFGFVYAVFWQFQIVLAQSVFPFYFILFFNVIAWKRMALRIHNCWTSFLKIYFYFCLFVTENISDFYQGDIKLDPELEDYIRNGGNSRNAIREKKRLWNTRIIPYYIPSYMSMYFRSISSKEKQGRKVFRLQNSPYFCVCRYVRAFKQKV